MNIFKKDFILGIVLVIIIIPLIVIHVRSQSWDIYSPDFGQLSDREKYWEDIATTPDGETVVAVSDGPYGDIWVSTDKGLSWTNETINTDNHGLNFQSIAMDSTGQKMVAVGNNSGVFISTDHGETWANIESPYGGQNWRSVTSNSNGLKLAAVSSFLDAFNTGGIYTSADGGITWVNRTTGNASMSSKYWISIASNDNGNELAVVEQGGDIWVSTDSGQTWSDVSTSHPELTNVNWRSIDMDSTGNSIVALTADGKVFVSTDSGQTWVSRSIPIPEGISWMDVVINSSGSKITIVSGSGHILTSLDSGITWDTVAISSRPWMASAYDSSGGILYLVANAGVTDWGNDSDGGNFSGISSFTYLAPQDNTIPQNNTPTVSGGLIPLDFLTRQFNQQRVIDQQNCTITINSISKPCYSNRDNSFQVEPQSKTATTNKVFNFLNNLRYGMISEEVRNLQIYLNHIGYVISQSGLGSIGNETDYFGNLTKQALIRYQTDYNIFPNLGYFGPKTRDSFLKNNPLFIKSN